MKRKHPIKPRSIVLTVAICALALFWYSGHRPIAQHNSYLESAIGHASRLEISMPPRYSPDGSMAQAKPEVVITDRAEIDRILRNFKLPWHQRASGKFHECDGHLRINIVMRDAPEHLIRYDHGNGIYPIFDGEVPPGFSHLPVEACSKLNSYFKSIGYSSRDLGL